MLTMNLIGGFRRHLHGYRLCKECSTSKPTDQFVADTAHSRCLKCHARRRAEYRAEHPDVVRAQKRAFSFSHSVQIVSYSRKWRDRNPGRVRAYNAAYHVSHLSEMMLNNARDRAKRRALPFSITLTDIVIPDVCPVLGIPLHAGTHGQKQHSPTLDRIVPERGYVPGNVSVISHLANMIKSCGTAEQHERIAAWMRSVGAT